MIGNRICVVALMAASAIIGSAPSAVAAPFDGNWKVVAQTTRGHCQNATYGRDKRRPNLLQQWSLRRLLGARGRLGLSFRVCPRSNAVAGPRTASGAGRLGPYQGGGSWAGRQRAVRCLRRRLERLSLVAHTF